MLNSTTLEVAIGMALVYLLLSLFCTAINEAIAGILGSRARNLEAGLKSLFTEGMSKDGKTTLSDAIYAHGLVQSLYKTGTGLVKTAKTFPSYIPSRTFSSALLDILFGDKTNPTGPPKDLQGMIDKIKDLPDSKGKDAIMTLVTQAGGDIQKTRSSIEKWFDDGMDRAAGWYKRKTQRALFLIGLTVAIALNVDSIAVGRTLWVTPALRTYALTAAQKYAENHPLKSTSSLASAEEIDAQPAAPVPNTNGSTPAATAQTAIQSASSDLASLQALSLPIGWGKGAAPWFQSGSQDRGQGFLLALAGWLLTAIAMTLGAPFWFDTLNQFMVVRSTVKPREKSEVESSKDSH